MEVTGKIAQQFERAFFVARGFEFNLKRQLPAPNLCRILGIQEFDGRFIYLQVVPANNCSFMTRTMGCSSSAAGCAPGFGPGRSAFNLVYSS